jgi:hypothetical protein
MGESCTPAGETLQAGAAPARTASSEGRAEDRRGTAPGQRRGAPRESARSRPRAASVGSAAPHFRRAGTPTSAARSESYASHPPHERDPRSDDPLRGR